MHYVMWTAVSRARALAVALALVASSAGLLPDAAAQANGLPTPEDFVVLTVEHPHRAAEFVHAWALPAAGPALLRLEFDSADVFETVLPAPDGFVRMSADDLIDTPADLRRIRIIARPPQSALRSPGPVPGSATSPDPGPVAPPMPPPHTPMIAGNPPAQGSSRQAQSDFPGESDYRPIAVGMCPPPKGDPPGTTMALTVEGPVGTSATVLAVINENELEPLLTVTDMCTSPFDVSCQLCIGAFDCDDIVIHRIEVSIGACADTSINSSGTPSTHALDFVGILDCSLLNDPICTLSAVTTACGVSSLSCE